MENSFVLLYLTILLPPIQSKEDLQCVVFTKNIWSNQKSTLKLLLIACIMCCFVWREIAIASSDLKAMSTSPVSSLSSSSPTYPDMSLLASISAALKLLVSWRSDVSSNGTGAALPVTIDNIWFSLTSWYLSYPKNVWLSLVAFIQLNGVFTSALSSSLLLLGRLELLKLNYQLSAEALTADCNWGDVCHFKYKSK